ncbi:putative HTH-type transcriptional regulator YbaQ [compost metagenome]
MPRINAICLGKRAITASTALRLAKYFDTTPQFWMGLQAAYDLALEEEAIGSGLDRVKVLKRA